MDNDGRRRIVAHKDRSCPLQDALLAAGRLDGNELRKRDMDVERKTGKVARMPVAQERPISEISTGTINSID